MEKVKIIFKKEKPKKIKICGQTIEVKPYIEFNDIISANKICLEQFFNNAENDEQFDLFPAVRLAFDSIVLNQCTNIDFDGILWDEIISANIMPQIRKYIFNYDDVFAQILESIRLKNIFVGLKTIGETLPTENKMESTIKETSSLIKELNKNDPQTLRKMVQTVAISNGIEQIKLDDKERIKEEKTVKRAERTQTKKQI